MIRADAVVTSRCDSEPREDAALRCGFVQIQNRDRSEGFARGPAASSNNTRA